MTTLVDDSDRVIRTPQVTARLLQLVEREPSLEELVAPAPEHIPWGATSIYFAGHWAPTRLDALLKVGVSATQRYWSGAVARRDPELAPRVLASGDRLGGADIGWVLLERLPGGLHPGWGGAEFGLLMDAGARFQRIARDIDPAPASELTVDDVRGWMTAAADRGAPAPVGTLLGRLDDDWRFVLDVCDAEICHGDLHMANVLMRVPAPELAPALLIDFEPCRMPWVFDAAYPQVLNSGPARSGWQDMTGQLAERRRVHGLPVCSDPDLERAAAIALAWYALRMWGMIGAAPDPGWRTASVWREQNEAYIVAGASAESRLRNS